MADLIDRAPMLEFIDLQHYDKDMQVTQYSPDWIYSWLESQTAVDAVEVIRCKECIGRITWIKSVDFAANICGMSGMFPRGETDYCGYGERRTDATD